MLAKTHSAVNGLGCIVHLVVRSCRVGLDDVCSSFVICYGNGKEAWNGKAICRQCNDVNKGRIRGQAIGSIRSDRVGNIASRFVKSGAKPQRMLLTRSAKWMAEDSRRVA